MRMAALDREAIIDEYGELIALYYKTKIIVIEAERENKQQELSAPAIVEARNAFDHIMRVEAVLYEI